MHEPTLASPGFRLSRFNILSSQDVPVNYIYCPKNACSTIKATLLRQSVNPHELAEAEFSDNPINPDKPFFIVVRNPFSRFLSAFLDKIGPGKDHVVWNSISSRYGLDCQKIISMDDFLELLIQDDPYCIDPHFRPQTILHNQKYLRPRFIGRFEDMSSVQVFFRDMGFELLTWMPHARSASSHLDSIGARSIALIRRLYCDDFIAYNYNEDHLAPANTGLVVQEQVVSGIFRRYCEHQGDDVESIVELANHSDRVGESAKALELMELALYLRPQGPYINKHVLRLRSSVGINLCEDMGKRLF